MKKSFLTDAMNEMEYGSGHGTKDTRNNKTADTSKPTEANRIVSITRIYPSNVVKVVNENDDEKSSANTPILAEQQSNKDNKNEEKSDEQEITETKVSFTDNITPTVTYTSAIANVTTSNNVNKVTENNSGKSQASHPHKDVNIAIDLLKSFVKKLLKRNNTKQTIEVNKDGKNVTEIPEKKDMLKKNRTVNPSTIIAGVKYNLAPVYQFRTKQENNDHLKHLKEEEETLQQTLKDKQLEIEQLRKEQNTNATHHPINSTADQTKHKNDTNDHPSKSKQKIITPVLVSKVNNTVIQSQNENNEAQFKFATLKGVPPELLVKLKDILDKKKQKKENLISKQQEASRKAFETANKLVKAAFAREQLYKAEEDFFEKVKEMMNKTSAANLLDNNNTTTLTQGSGDGENDLSPVKDYVKSLEAEQKAVGSVERRTQPIENSSGVATAQSVTNQPPAPASTPGQTKSNPGGLPLNTVGSNPNILNKLNHTKGPDEKSVEAAAHLEEKVAEQQDEMYDDLLRHTLNKGRFDDDDDDDDEDEEAAARDREVRPSKYGQMPQLHENYGDFQDTDERAHARSEVTDKESSEKVHYIDENAIFSLKKNYISRPRLTTRRSNIRRN